MIRRFWKFFTLHIDGFLLATLAATLLFGLFLLYSASGESFDRVLNQATSMLVALAAMWALANLPPQHLVRIAWPSYVVGLLLLLAVALFGEISNGARRWLHLGVVRIQPSELLKIAVPMMLAWYFEKRERSMRLSDFAIAAILLLLPVMLIAKQPDLGTALMIAASGFFVLFLAGIGWKVILGLAVSAAAFAPVAWSLMHDYQQQRVMTLIDPTQDPLGTGYHTIQSTIALGSGGLFGKGWLNGSQTHLDFLPERHTDFIFAVLGEELGLFGILLLLTLYLLIITRGLYITSRATTMFSRLIAGSITMTFGTYAFVNMGMVSGILPVVGVPLPLISFGGTSLVTMMLGFGILMSVATHRRLVRQ